MPLSRTPTQQIMPVAMSTQLVANSTVYVGPLGPQVGNTVAAYSIAGKSGTITGFQVSSSAFPGAGQSYTYTLYKNGAATALTGTVSGAAQNTLLVTGAVSISGYDNFQLQIVSSITASAAYHTGNILISLNPQ